MLNPGPHHNARYAKLRIVWRQRNRHGLYGRVRKVESLPAPSCISRKIIGDVTSAQQSIEVLSAEFPLMRRYQGTVISQDDIFKIIGNKGRVTYVTSCFAIFRHYDLSGAKTEPCDFIRTRTCRHKTFRHFLSDSPVVIDISIVAETDGLLVKDSLFVHAAYIHVGNIAQLNLAHGMFLS